MKKAFKVFLVILLLISIGFNIYLYKQIKGIEVDLQLLQEEKTTIENLITEKETILTEKDNKIEELQTTIEDLQQKIEVLKEQLTTLNAEKEALSAQVEETKNEIEAKREDQSSIKGSEQSSTTGGAGHTAPTGDTGQINDGSQGEDGSMSESDFAAQWGVTIGQPGSSGDIGSGGYGLTAR